MRRCVARGSTRLVAGGLLAGLLFAIVTLPLTAQPAREAHPFYDITKEVTISGAVSSVLPRHSAGTIPGAHLLLATASGEVDASLGRWGLQGKGALSVRVGQQVELTGIMKMIREKQVFVARTVKVGSRVYTIRNQHGIAVSPQARGRIAHQTGQKAETL
jgi:hypothetical protein